MVEGVKVRAGVKERPEWVGARERKEEKDCHRLDLPRAWGEEKAQDET